MLPYHLTTTALFKQSTDVWHFFASHSTRSEHIRQYKIDLLKNTYKFDSATDEAGLYNKLAVVKEKLGLELPVTIYQAENANEKNAGIIYLDGEAHLVFSGDFLQSFTEEELTAILAHEMSHVHLYTQANGDLEITDRIITAIASSAGSTAAQFETARLFKLYTEIFCDRGAHRVTGGYAPIVTSLVKLATGLQTVNAESYVQQAEEIFAADQMTKTAGLSHPENFIRARAIYLWHTKGEAANAEIEKMIEGHVGLDELDLHRQRRLGQLTQDIIQLLLQPEWMVTPQTQALAKQYFSKGTASSGADIEDLKSQIQTFHSSVQEYLAYVLYDFATTDKTLEDVPLGYGFYLANALGVDKPFSAAVKKEKKFTDKKVAALRKSSLAEYEKQILLTA